MSRKSIPIKADFHELMKELLQFMQIPLPAKFPCEVYSFSFEDKTEVNIFMPHAGVLDMLVDIGTLKNTKSETVLQNLLKMNRFIPDAFPISVGLDTVSGKVTLWSRHSLEGMELDGLNALLTVVLKYADVAQGYVNERSPAAPASTRQRPPAFNESSNLRSGR